MLFDPSPYFPRKERVSWRTKVFPRHMWQASRQHPRLRLPPFHPRINNHVPLWSRLLYLFIVTVTISAWVFADTAGNIPPASAATTALATNLSVPGATNTLAQFLKQSKVSPATDGLQVGAANQPNLTHHSNAGSPPATAAQAAKPSAESPTMKASSQSIPASSLSASAINVDLPSYISGNSTTITPALHLSGRDSNGTRMEVAIPTGALDFSVAKAHANGAPQGNLTVTLTQIRGHYFTATTELSAYTLQITDAKGFVVQGIRLRLPITYTFHYRANELTKLGVDPNLIYLVLTPATTKSATVIAATKDGAASTVAASSNTSTVLLTNNATTSTLSATSSVLAIAASITSGPDPIQTPAKPRFASVQGNSGQLSYSYPLEVAPGPNGTEPSLAVGYSSGATNARHSPNSPAGPVGDGWSLSLGEITASQDSSNNTWYSLSGVDGISDRLIPNINNSGSVYNYQTEHLSYLKVERVDPTSGSTTGQHYFLVWDKSGTEYEFGNTPDSLEYHINSSGTQINYAYALDKVIPANEGAGTNNRTMILTYVQDKESRTTSGTTSTWIRDYGLKRITYGTTSNGNTTLAGTVDFFYNGPTSYTDASNNVTYITTYTSAYSTACNLPTTPPQVQRCDDPIDRTISGTQYVDPDVMSTLELTGVKSYVGSDSTTSNLDYSYAFSYTDTAFATCPSADTTLSNYWCAGNHLLTSIVPTAYQNGTGHSMAGVTFGYSGARTNKYDDTSQSYHMENAWNYLSSYHDHSNGVGAAAITYHTAYNNSNGTAYFPASAGGPDNRYDAFFCTWHLSDSYTCANSPWNPPDNKMWTEQTVYEIDSQGKDSSSSTITPAVTKYEYWLNKTGGTCSADSTGNTDCIGYGWMPDYTDTTSAANYYDGEFRGFGTVLIHTPSQDLTVEKYVSTFGWNSPGNGNGSPATDPRNYLTGSLLEEDVFSGNSIDCSKLLTQTLNDYAGEAVQTQTCGTSSFSSTPASCSTVYVKSPYTACEVILLATRKVDWEASNTAGPSTESDYTYDDYRSSGTTSGLGSFFASPATGSYHNLQQEVSTSSNAPTETQNWTYYTTNTTVGTTVFYIVDKVAHSEVVDSSGTKWSCSDTTYDEGVASGVPTPAAGLPTTVKTYSTCGNSSTALMGYTGYDTDGNIVATVDSVAAANPTLYNSSGCTLTTAPTFLSSSWTAGRFTGCSAYRASNALPTDSWNALSHHTSMVYDATQGLLPTSTTDVNGQTTSKIYSFDSNGNPIEQVKDPGESGTYTRQNTLITTCTDSSTLPCQEEDSNEALYSSAVSRVFYDSMGRDVETLTPGPDSTHTTVTFTIYNDTTNSSFTSHPFVVAARTTWLDPNGAIDYNGIAPGGTTVTLDALGRKLTTTDALSIVATTTFSVGSSGVSGDSNIYKIITAVDANGHVGKTYDDALGRAIYNVDYSGVNGGTLTAVKRTTSAYNVLDKQTSMSVIDLAPQTGQTITTVTTTTTYDALGQIISVVDPDRGTTTHRYDANGNVIGVTTTSGSSSKVIGTKYDLLDRVGCVQDVIPTDVSASGACSSGANPYLVNTYDADPSGVTWSSTNYPVGKLTQSVTSTSYPAPDNATGTVTENYQYDQREQTVTSLLNLAVSGGSNVVFPTFPTYKQSSTYNDAGQAVTTTTSVGSSTGSAVTQVYDSTTGIETSLTSGAIPLASLAYNTRDLVSALTLNDSAGASLATQVMTYDGDLRPASDTTTWTSSGSTIYKDAVTYDSLGNVLSRASIQTAVAGVSGSGATEVQNFCYDENNQLVWASNATSRTASTGQTCGSTAASGQLGNSYTNSYAYTHLGQLWQAPLNGSGAQEQYLYCNTNSPHQLTALSPTSGSPTCASQGTTAYTANYDAYGNIVNRTYPSTTTGSPVYNAQDQMIRWSGTTSSAANGEWYLYDASGHRVMRRSASTTSSGNPATSAATITVYAFGGEEHVYAYAGSGSNLTNTGNTYYYSIAGRLIGESNGSSTNYYLTDLLGSVVSTFSNTVGSAVVLGNQVYGPYGNLRYSAGTMGTAKGFTGQYADDLTGLDFYVARYYDPISGRFLSADSVVGNVQGADPYAYVDGNPETRNDPTGNCPWCIGALVGAIVGGVIGVGVQAVSNYVEHKPLSNGLLEAGVSGVVSGAIIGALGPAGSALAATAGEAAAGLVGGAAGKLASNMAADWHHPSTWGHGVLQAAATGFATGAIGGALGYGAGKLLSKIGNKLLPKAAAVLGCGLSFSADTQVATPNGEKPISALQVGDKVQAFDPTTKKQTTQAVQQVYINHDTDLLNVTLTLNTTAKAATHTETGKSKEQGVAVASHGSHAPPEKSHTETINTTDKHPWLTTRGWVKAGDLHLGDRVLRLDGSIATVTILRVVPGTQEMYDLTVSNVHTFAVGVAQFVVHNCLNTRQIQAGINQAKNAAQGGTAGAVVKISGRRGIIGQGRNAILDIAGGIRGRFAPFKRLAPWQAAGKGNCAEFYCSLSVGRINKALDIFIWHRRGSGPCAACQSTLQRWASSNGAPITAYWRNAAGIIRSRRFM